MFDVGSESFAKLLQATRNALREALIGFAKYAAEDDHIAMLTSETTITELVDQYLEGQ